MGRIKDYLIWHYDKYGEYHTEMSRVDEFLHDEKTEHEEWESKQLTKSIVSELIIEAPSIGLLLALKQGHLLFDELKWMDFEDVVAELLSRNDFDVQVGKRRKDGGVDIFAEKHIPGIGRILTVWQAKKLLRTNKVGISTIRELADTRNEFKASKGIIVTNTSLTRGAIERIERDRYILDKIDGDELIEWIKSSPLC